MKLVDDDDEVQVKNWTSSSFSGNCNQYVWCNNNNNDDDTYIAKIHKSAIANFTVVVITNVVGIVCCN